MGEPSNTWVQVGTGHVAVLYRDGDGWAVEIFYGDGGASSFRMGAWESAEAAGVALSRLQFVPQRNDASVPAPADSDPADVLVVDDDPPIRATIMQVLDEHGYKVAGAANGIEALQRLRRSSKPPKLILLDLAMPHMDGWHLRERLRQDPELRKIPVVLLSAVRGIDLSAKDLEIECYMAKPVALPALLAVVERFC